jgi:predicted RNA-binding Zn-ribbon protein involved in translation (DUF1610 family)
VQKTYPIQYSVITVARNSESKAWIIEHRCPQCGAPITLEETDRFFACPYCRVRICLTTGDFFRYYLPARDTAPAETFYVPYWRIKGMIFSCDGDFEVRQSLLDATHSACNDPIYPESLGLRPQALKLRFAATDAGLSCMKSTLSFDEAFSKIQAGLPVFQQAGRPVSPFYRSFMGEKVSLVYAPFYVRGDVIFDAVLGEPVRATSGAARVSSSQERIEWSLKVLPALCPDCGYDLDGGRESIALFCKNCNTVWCLAGAGLEKMPFSLIASADDDTHHLPFWRIKARIRGFTLESFGDLARLANLPRVIKREWESQPLFFWVPAFKVNAGLLLRLSRQMTIDQNNEEMEIDGVPSSPFPVTFPVHESTESLKTTISALIATKKRLWPVLKDLAVDPVESLLVYVPFRQQGEELVQPRFQLSVAINSLKYGEHL